MNPLARNTSSTVLKIGGLTTVGLMLIAAAIGWRHFGTDILLNAASAGLSWCF